MLSLILAAMLHWTNPSTREGLGPTGEPRCDLTGVILTDLRTLIAYGRQLPNGDWQVIGSKDVSGREGLADSLAVNLAGSWEAFVRSTDARGDTSCASNHVTGGDNVSVALTAWDLAQPRRYYDLAGRRVEPVRPGCYWWRQGKARGAVVVR